MIAPMKKVFIVGRSAASDRLLEALRELGVVHLESVDASAKVPERLMMSLHTVQHALQAIGSVQPAGEAPVADPSDAAHEIVSLVRQISESRNRLNALAREVQRLALWGGLRREQLDALADAGVAVTFWSVPAKHLAEVSAECLATVAELPGRRVLVAVAQRGGEPQLPDDATPIEPPDRDLPTAQAEAAEVEQAMTADVDRLAALAHLAEALDAQRDRVQADVDFASAQVGALSGDDLFAVQGWAPADRAATLADDLATRGLDVAVEGRDPAADENPPTLIRYPRWARPVESLFELLSTNPGYREFDVSGFFMLSLPVFVALLIGDAGYGILFLLAGLAAYPKAKKTPGAVSKVHLVLILGAVTTVWGLMTGNVFGLTPGTLTEAGGFWAVIGGTLGRVQVIPSDLEAQADQIMRISFIIGAIHLTLAQLRQSLKFLPDLRFVAHVGWALFLWGMLGVIWYFFFTSQQEPPGSLHPAAAWLLVIGGVLAITFTAPSRNPLKMIAVGLASFPLTAMGTFSDIISYIRLMVVGLASVVIAQTFNTLGADCAGVATWFVGAPVIVIGHALNVALCLIALLAHGVRLNMLEFSNNAGVQWTGYAYEPFSTRAVRRA